MTSLKMTYYFNLKLRVAYHLKIDSLVHSMIRLVKAKKQTKQAKETWS